MGVASIRCVRPILMILSHAFALAARLGVQRFSAGINCSLTAMRHRHVHRGGKRVVGRLPHVDVVVGMDACLDWPFGRRRCRAS